MTRTRMALVLACALLASAPAAADAAGTVTVLNISGGELEVRFQAAPGVANDVTLVNGPGTVTVQDTAEVITEAATECTGSGTNSVTCTSPSITSSEAKLGDLGDRLVGGGPLPLFAFGDAGNDIMTLSSVAGSSDLRLLGGDGDDTLTGGNGDDGAAGGPGVDSISLGNGEDSGEGGGGDGDTVDLGAGNDDAYLYAVDGNGDTYLAGPGLDQLYADPGTFPPPPIALVLDLAAGTLGGTGTGAATVRDFEDADLSGHTTTNVTGSAGANDIKTRGGADTVNPGAGPDFLDLSAGEDSAFARDGFADFVRCGPGSDSAEVDQLDTTTGCENVAVARVRPAAADTAPPACEVRSVRARVKRAILLKRGVAPSVTCNEPASLEIQLLIRPKPGRVHTARAGDLVLADAARRLATGTRKVRLRVARRLRAAIPRTAKLRLVVEARDQFGNVQVVTKRISVRTPRRRT